ncbi:SatD family protein [Ignavibacterium sp.]|uniref:SatD family protein n=1 Tax=Ignavibacterium sp. TaxID=2651167 RepID=UPI003299ADAD
MTKVKPKVKLYSVITADIVKSSKLSISKHKKLIEVIKICATEIKKVFPATLQYAPEYFRGDSWQVVLKKPEYALAIALYYRAFIKANMEINTIDARMAISLGSIDFVKKSFGVGEAYKTSGEAIDIKGKRRLKFIYDKKEISELLDLLVENSDFISSRWTVRQCKVILLSLKGYNQLQIAKKIKVTQQAVSQQLDSAGWSVISKNIAYFQNTIEKLT